MKTYYHTLYTGIALSLLLLLAGCGPAVTTDQTQTQTTPTINPGFQSQITPVPTVPPYRCGSWASNNAPSGYSTITIYARITKNIAPVSGATAIAIVHFKGFDLPLDAQSPSDGGGYVTFVLQLQGRQPSGIPATVDVTFDSVPGSTKPLHCTQAFF